MEAKKHWYKDGDALLREINSSLPPPNTVHLWYLGQHGFVFNIGGIVIYIDVILNSFPDKTGEDRRNYPHPFNPDAVKCLDYYISTHNHGDHLNLKTILPLAKANKETKFIVPMPYTNMLIEAGIEYNRVLGARAEEKIDCTSRESKTSEKISIIPVPAIHTPFIQDEGEKDAKGDFLALGFVFKAERISLYHPGDTWITPSLVDLLKKLGPLDIAMLPINGTDWERTASGCIGNVSVMDAVKLAMAIPIDLVIPCHYDMMPNNTENPAYFADSMYRYCPEKRYHICALGEKFVYEKP